jgi:hypothetical protein
MASSRGWKMADKDPSLFTRRTVAIAIVLVLLFAALLLLQGRPAWCKYGIGIWAGAWEHCTSQHLFDPYSLSHVLHGIIFYWMLVPFASKFALAQRNIAALVIEIGWELLENSAWVIERYRQQTAALDYFGDSVVNAVCDVAASVLGFAFASWFSWKVSVATFLAFELLLLWAARDNLTLNVVMLFWPIDAIKQWQLGGS